MSSKYFTIFPVTFASFATLSSEVDVGNSWGQVYLEVPTMTSNTQIHIQVANATGGTFRRVMHPPINSSTSSFNDFAITSQATQRVVPIPSGHRYYKIETTAICSFSPSFNIICGD